MATESTTHRTRTGAAWPVLAALLLAATAGAAEKRELPGLFDPDRVPVQGIREPARMTAERSNDRIVRDVERKHKAKVVKDPEERQIDGRRVIVLRLFDEKKGRVWEVRVDAETGKEL